jgi:hypothetical protein
MHMLYTTWQKKKEKKEEACYMLHITPHVCHPEKPLLASSSGQAYYLGYNFFPYISDSDTLIRDYLSMIIITYCLYVRSYIYTSIYALF